MCIKKCNTQKIVLLRFCIEIRFSRLQPQELDISKRNSSRYINLPLSPFKSIAIGRELQSNGFEEKINFFARRSYSKSVTDAFVQ